METVLWEGADAQVALGEAQVLAEAYLACLRQCPDLEDESSAEALGVTTKTVAYHVANVLSKLGVCSRLAAARWMHKHFPEDLVEIPG